MASAVESRTVAAKLNRGVKGCRASSAVRHGELPPGGSHAQIGISGRSDTHHIAAIGRGWLQAQSSSRPVLYEGARLIIGDTSAPIENGALLVENGRFMAVGPRSSVTTPAGVIRVDLSGKTVMPAMVNAHVHIGYEGYTSWRAENHTPRNVLDHLRREAFYGVAATTSVGTSPTEQALQIQRDQQAGKFPPSARFLFMPGMAPPGGGPDADLIVATNKLGVINEVSTPEAARALCGGWPSRGLAT